MLDFPAAALALWALCDAGGPRPEYVLPVLYAESQFDPSVQNTAGAANYGINQASAELLGKLGINSAEYVTWPASEQIARVVAPMLLGIAAHAGPLRSATRVEQANFLPATLPYVRELGGTLARAGDALGVYAGNRILDRGKKGKITLGDLATFVRSSARTRAVSSAIAQTYRERPWEVPREPVYGEDFEANPLAKAAAVAGGALLFAGLATP